MASLHIVTDDWIIVNYDDFMFVRIVKAEDEDSGDEIYVLAGIVDEERNYMALCTSNDAGVIIDAFNDITTALDGKKPFVDLRAPEVPNIITLLTNGQHGSELN